MMGDGVVPERTSTSGADTQAVKATAFEGHEAVQIVRINDEDHSFSLDEDALNKILNDDKIKDKPVCVVSVAGTIQ